MAITAVACAAVVLPTPALPGKACVCKANGRDYHEGQIACILGHLARCEMFLNNTTWKQIAEDCPEASLRPDLLTRLQQLQDSPPAKAC